MLWEKKIQLEKETQDALDPTLGMQEAEAMEREIHRMELRYAALKRDQEEMIKEMEKAVWKKEVIIFLILDNSDDIYELKNI